MNGWINAKWINQSSYKSLNEWMNELMNQSSYKSMNEWMN